jgi:NAD(P)-dependent dehydrogenase (short-subunit alcohol dehydrogenase family)
MADVTVADIEAARAAARYPSLKDKAVLVTGGASGIGASTVVHFMVQGAKVGFIDRDRDAAEALLATLKEAGLQEAGETAPLFVACDLTDINAARAAARQIEDRHGPIRVLVNNAARDDRHTLAEVTPEYWDDRINVNLRHQFFMAQFVVPGMAKAGGGSIVNLGSTSWKICTEDLAVYQTAKAGVVGLTRGLARDLGPSRIRVNHVAPGWIMTERQQSMWLTPEGERELMTRQCLKRKLYPDDIARVVLFLCADDSSAMTNQSYIVDGGWV